MLSFAAGLLPVPLFSRANAFSDENGFVRRPHPAASVVQEAELLLMNQIMPATVIETVAVRFDAADVMFALSLSV